MLQHYTDERNIQIVISLLKAHGIKRVVVSPGATNVSFVASIQQDSFFEIYSAIDERSAAYIACGMAAESGEAVVLSCTGATASRNYMPALTEAYYRNLPVLAITSAQHSGRIGALIPQVIDRFSQPNDLVKLSVHLPTITTQEDEWNTIVKANTAILELFHHGTGPVHINLATVYSQVYSVKELPPVRKISRIMRGDTFPELPDCRIGIFVGAHIPWPEDLTKAVNAFCKAYDAAVFCDHTSNYEGEYRVDFSLACYQSSGWKDLLPDLLIHIGQVSGDYPSYKVGETDQTQAVWRVSPDGKIADTFRKMTYMFEMDEYSFFQYYSAKASGKRGSGSYAADCRDLVSGLLASLPDLPFSNIWIASQTASSLPTNCAVHLGILNSLRSWNLFPFPKGIHGYSNTGGFGIDGCVSSCLGGSLVQQTKIHFLILGDLAFFYDMNALGNRHIGRNIRILLVNNGKGTEFRNFNHPASAFERDADCFMAAGGHYGNKSSTLVRHYAEDLGFKYYSASTKEEYLKVKDDFFQSGSAAYPMLLEVFTDSQDESKALQMALSLRNDLKKTVKDAVKATLGKNATRILKEALQRKNGYLQ